jgi:4-hydroxy-tetrahydrodipicolinate synthase
MSMFTGALTALITPFRDGALDEAAFRALVERQIAAGIDGLVPCGTTGEAPTLTIDEHAAVIRWTVEQAAGRVPVLAGVGSNDTRTAIDNSLRARDNGAQGLLVTAPYYNKPTQEGLFRHFEAVAAAVPECEVCVYDVPGRTGVKVAPETFARLAEVPGITCVKDATADLAHAADIVDRVGDALTLLSGDDFTTFPHVMVGGSGCISVASNLVPGRIRAMVAAARAGDAVAPRLENAALQPLFRALFIQTNPLPVKTALALMGLCAEEFRLPLCRMDAGPRAALADVLQQYELLEA